MRGRLAMVLFGLGVLAGFTFAMGCSSSGIGYDDPRAFVVFAVLGAFVIGLMIADLFERGQGT